MDVLNRRLVMDITIENSVKSGQPVLPARPRKKPQGADFPDPLRFAPGGLECRFAETGVCVG